MGLIRLLFQNKSLILLCFFVYILFWLTISTFKQSTNIPTTPKVNQLVQHQSNSSFYSILDYLSHFHVKLLLIDPYVLNYLFIRHLSFDNLEQNLITFAITDKLIPILLKSFQGSNYSIKTSQSVSANDKTSLDHIFIEYKQKTIHVAVLHKHNSYYLIEKNTLPLPDDIQLSYGDTLRAIEAVDTELIKDGYSFFTPRNVSHFLWLYKTSQFLHCNRTLTNEMENEFDLHQNASQLNLTVIPMRSIVSALENLEKHYWLAGGTLLGWYRHCGLIPFTQDADFGLFAEEYDESIRNHFLGNSISYLWGALGLVNDSLEFRLYTGRYTLDLFWAYRENDHRWCGYQVNRAKFRRRLPLLSTLCSGDLFGYRFSIPCTPVDYLDSEYGKDNWQSPLERDYTWANMKYHSMWNDISWMYATRLYTSQGKLRTDKFAIDWISKHFNYSISTIPSFLNVVPDGLVTLPPLKSELVYGVTKKPKKDLKKNVK